MGPYNRPYNPTLLESCMMRTGQVCLEFRVNGSPENSALQLKVDWTYVHHGMNRDSTLGKIYEPQLFEILTRLNQLEIPPNERQSADKLGCEKIARDALRRLQGRVPRRGNPTDQVHIIVKLHRLPSEEEKIRRTRWKQERHRLFERETVEPLLADISAIPGFR